MRFPTNPVSRSEEASIRQLTGWIRLAAVLLFVAMATPFFLGRVFIADDLGEFHLPLRDFYASQLKLGEPFDWMNSLYGGFYVTGEGQLGAYHPWHLALYRWLPMGAAFNIELLANYPALFVGTYLLLMRLLMRRDAASFGALVFTFSSFNLLHFVHPNAMAVVAHLPWLLIAVDVALVTPSAMRRAMAEFALTLLTASQLLIGYPQYVWLTLVVVVAFAVWRCIGLGRPRRDLAALVLAVGLGFLVGGIQLLPTADALANSVRSVHNAEFANNGSLHPLNLMQLFAPYLLRTRVLGQNTHELGLYLGAVPLLLCVWLLARRREQQQGSLVVAALVLGAVALAMAFGQYAGLDRLQAWLPLVNRFRFPCRAIVVVELAMAVVAAVAIGKLRDRPNPHAATWPLITVFAVSVLLALVAPYLWPDYVADAALIWCGPALIGAAAVLIALAERGVPAAWPALVLFTAIDLGAYGLSYAVYEKTADLHKYVAQIPRPPGNSDARIAVEHEDSAARVGDRMLLAGIKRVDGYAGLEPKKSLDYQARPALELAGVQWMMNTCEPERNGGLVWTEVVPTAARARLLQSAAEMPTKQVECPLFEDVPGRIRVRVESATSQLLVTTESFHEGWQATCDDGQARVVRVDGDFVGCIVPAGAHDVTLQFQPFSLWAGKIVSLCGLGLTCGVFWTRRRMQPRPTQEETDASPCDSQSPDQRSPAGI